MDENEKTRLERSDSMTHTWPKKPEYPNPKWNENTHTWPKNTHRGD